MSQIHVEFYRSVSASLHQWNVDFKEFNRERDYPTVKMDLCDFEDPVEIAATALCDLCVGGQGAMDSAVITAVVNFLEARLNCRGLIEDCIRELNARIPFVSVQICRAWIRQWFV